MDQTLRNRPRDLGSARSRFLSHRFGRELRAERIGNGITQGELGRRAGISQARVSQIEHGRGGLSFRVAARLAAGVGGELSLRLYPGDGIRLRDSGQLGLAETIRHRLPATARIALEAPIGTDPRDLRAADLLVRMGDGLVMIEVERVLSDAQAQLRRAELKRADLARRLGQPVVLILAVADTARNRRVARSALAVLQAGLPSDARTVWRCLGAGLTPPSDGLLWVRERPLRRAA